MFAHVLPNTSRMASYARLPHLPRRLTREREKKSTPATLYHKHRTPILQAPPAPELQMLTRMMRQAGKAKKGRRVITRLSSRAFQVRVIALALLYMLLIIPALDALGKHSMKKDDYLTSMMMIPPKQPTRIHQFDVRTQQEAFAVSPEGLKGVCSVLLVCDVIFF